MSKRRLNGDDAAELIADATEIGWWAAARTDPRRALMRLRLAELIAALSLATDLGLGMPQEHVLRQCRIALALAERVGVDDAERAAVYYTAMLAWVVHGRFP